MATVNDPGYFGPDSVSWQVHREVTVLFGGARALLMQAAHPLVVAGANQTGMYERNPWKRLQRTLILTYTMTFGTKAEAHAAADKINEVHTRINGVDPVTGKSLRRARSRPAALRSRVPGRFGVAVRGAHRRRARRRGSSAVPRGADARRGTLPGAARHRSRPRCRRLRAWLADFEDRGDLQVTDGARRVLDLFFEPPPEAEWRPVLRGVSRLAYGTLPAGIREMYGLPFGPVKRAAMRATFPADPRGAAPPAAEVPLHRALPGLPAAPAGDRTGRSGSPRRASGWASASSAEPSPSWETAPMGLESGRRACCSTSTACS